MAKELLAKLLQPGVFNVIVTEALHTVEKLTADVTGPEGRRSYISARRTCTTADRLHMFQLFNLFVALCLLHQLFVAVASLSEKGAFTLTLVTLI